MFALWLFIMFLIIGIVVISKWFTYGAVWIIGKVKGDA